MVVRNKDLGYRKDLLITLNVPFNGQSKYQVLKDEMKKMHGVEAYRVQIIYLPETNGG